MFCPHIAINFSATHRSMRGYLSLATVDANSTQTHIEHTIDRELSQRFPSILITRMHFVVSQGFVPKIGPEPSPNGGRAFVYFAPFLGGAVATTRPGQWHHQEQMQTGEILLSSSLSETNICTEAPHYHPNSMLCP